MTNNMLLHHSFGLDSELIRSLKMQLDGESNPFDSLPLRALSIPSRVIPYLKARNVVTVGDLRKHTIGSLMAIRGVGQNAVSDMMRELSRMGLALQPDKEFTMNETG